jgi:hypothetical protein
MKTLFGIGAMLAFLLLCLVCECWAAATGKPSSLSKISDD